MKKTTKNRIIMATLGLLLTVVSAFVAGGLTSTIIYICEYGLKPPEMFGWIGAFYILGMYAIISTAPGLLIVLIMSIIKYSHIKLRILFNIIIAFTLSSIITLLWCIDYINLDNMSGRITSGVICIFIVIIAELLLRNKFQKKLN